MEFERPTASDEWVVPFRTAIGTGGESKADQKKTWPLNPVKDRIRKELIQAQKLTVAISA